MTGTYIPVRTCHLFIDDHRPTAAAEGDAAPDADKTKLAQQNQQLKAKLQEVVVRYKKLQKELTEAKTGSAETKDGPASSGTGDKSEEIAKLTAEKHQAVTKLKEVVTKYK
jgi:chaperonin cofactor prefoldin